ncbi:cation:proton antiporter [Kroppenstedtia eburnea]|uniref:Kef-type K+ transport system, membrane component KefB n=1 Tax=Kroppenstedtia eburnea TaxID=714067 RepID=A0A1N7PSH2_9BACL|nr:cation:proton antiporter [Kroppenstedtia eburnea]EGK12799.1 CPA2 family monovalent cation:proton (H+) antiporter-2 [Desmospora sp. 8437]QKI82677.1 cation:proton antiporter [Kroppenstedtia eburnea]SIT13526.1 Kef-type K+ transport system, membrane component KefB [Kroppenstedtia eburnea]
MDLIEKLVDIEKLKDYHFLLELVIILAAVKLAGHFSKKIGQPSVFGELLVGIILGPAILGWIVVDPKHPGLIKELAEVGVILLMFLAGLETDVEEFKKTAYGSSLVAVGGVIFPLILGFAVGLMFGYNTSTSIFIGTLLVATSVSISVQTLRELGQLQSKEGVTILGAAVLDDVLGIILLSVVVGFTAGGGGGSVVDIMILLAKIILFFVLTIVIGRFLLPRLFNWSANLMTSEVLLAFGIISALSFAYLAEMFGLAGIVGSYFAGLMLSLTKYRTELFERVEIVSFSFFVPIFFVSIGVTADVSGLTKEILILMVVLSLVAILTKVIGAGLGAKLAGFNWNSSLGIGTGMIARGEVGLIVASIGLTRGLIDSDLFTVTVIIVLVTTLVTPPLLKAIFSRKKVKQGS